MDPINNQALANQFKDPAGSSVGQGAPNLGQKPGQELPQQSVSAFGQPSPNKAAQTGSGVDIKQKNTIGFTPKGAIV